MIRKLLLKIAQRILNSVYEKEGLTDKILELQIKINKLRHESNIPDETLLNDGGYVQ